MLRFIFLFGIMLSSTSWAVTCKGNIGEFQIVQSETRMKEWLLANEHRAADFDLKYGQGAAAAILEENYSEFLRQTGCGAVASRVTLRRVRIPINQLRELCAFKRPTPLKIGNGEKVYVRLNEFPYPTVLVYDNDHSCELRRFE